jgi:DNA-binding CsgD family transcriptional regulator
MPRSAATAQMPMVRGEALVDFLEALYRWDTSDEAWLRGLCGPLLQVVPSGLWVQANTFDVSDYRFRCPTLVSHGAPPSLEEHFLRESERFTPDVIARCYYATSVATLGSGPAEVRTETGAGGVLAIKGLDPSGRSAALNVGLPERKPLAHTALRILRKVAWHIATAARVRRRIAAAPGTAATSGAEAVFSTTHGVRLVHAEAAARGRAEREELTLALRMREAARARESREQPLDSWRPVVDARWTLVDTYESDGARYIVARENHAEVGGLEALTERERQVASCLAFGQTTKEIAYSLGIDASTVRVLLQRAAAKLRVAGRAGLLDHPDIKALRGGLDAAALQQIRSSEGGR